MSQELEGIGALLRRERQSRGMSQRDLARRLQVTASFISQLESGIATPSVATLYALVSEFDVALDELLNDRELSMGPVTHAEERATIVLDSGVSWEQLVTEPRGDVDFLYTTYPVGGTSTPNAALLGHRGREYGFVISGRLGLQVGDQEYELDPGDSIAFDSSTPHRLFNKGSVQVEAIWLVVRRREQSGSSP